MTQKLNIARIHELKNNAYDNIDSYDDPDTPNALAQFTSQIKTVLQADPQMLESVPEYLPVALYGRVKFPSEAKLKWAQWINSATLPAWDDFKTTIGFNNADLPLVKAVLSYSETLLIESCAVLYLLEVQGKITPDPYTESHDDDDYHDSDGEEAGYYDHYDNEDNA